MWAEPGTAWPGRGGAGRTGPCLHPAGAQSQLTSRPLQALHSPTELAWWGSRAPLLVGAGLWVMGCPVTRTALGGQPPEPRQMGWVWLGAGTCTYLVTWLSETLPAADAQSAGGSWFGPSPSLQRPFVPLALPCQCTPSMGYQRAPTLDSAGSQARAGPAHPPCPAHTCLPSPPPSPHTASWCLGQAQPPPKAAPLPAQKPSARGSGLAPGTSGLQKDHLLGPLVGTAGRAGKVEKEGRPKGLSRAARKAPCRQGGGEPPRAATTWRSGCWGGSHTTGEGGWFRVSSVNPWRC